MSRPPKIFLLPPDNSDSGPTAPLTPAGLAEALECHSTDSYRAIGESLYTDDRPKWLKPAADNGHSGMIGMDTYTLAQPLDVFGTTIDRVSFLNEWVVVELRRDQAMRVIREKSMARAPMKLTEQYYRFVDDENGPMLGAFAPTSDGLAMAFGADPDQVPASKTLFVGCNYAAVSKADFLTAARQADATIRGAASDIGKMIMSPPKSDDRGVDDDGDQPK